MPGVARLTLPDPTVCTRFTVAPSAISAIRRGRTLASALAEQIGRRRRQADPGNYYTHERARGPARYRHDILGLLQGV